MDSYSAYIHKSRYARWLDLKQRRETWEETIQRYVDFFSEHLKPEEQAKIFNAIHQMKVMPSMRALMTAGEALARDNVAGFNCSYLAIDDPRAFDEMMYVLMCGTGVGFSVERQFTSQLPSVAEELYPTETTITVSDSKIGWASSFRELIALLYAGQIPKWDLSRVRKAGAKLKTFGGRASGPEPLNDLFKFAVNLFKKAAGRKLSSIECHDLACKVADIVVVGGVRRSALISLSNPSDDRMRRAKHGQWWETEPQRALANNSACYTEKPDFEAFLSDWTALYESRSGERGVFSRVASQKQAAKNGRRDPNREFGTNPCCVSGDTKILTDKGYVEILSVIGKQVNVWNGNQFSEVTPFETGFHPTVVVELSDGTSLRCTPNHKFVVDAGRKTRRIGDEKVDDGRHEVRVEAKDLVPGQKLLKYEMPVIEGEGGDLTTAYSQGFYSGDGNEGLEYSWLYEPKYVVSDRLIGVKGEQHASVKRKMWMHGAMLSKTFVPFYESKQYRLEWLAGLIDADGCVAKDKGGRGIHIAAKNHAFLSDIRLMLTTLGVQAKISKMHDAKEHDFGKGGKKYLCCPVFRLLINQADTHFLMSIGLKTSRVNLGVGGDVQRDARRFVKIVGVKEDQPCETYCFDEPINHTGTFNGIVTGQSEIILRPNQFCNLSEIVCRSDDTKETLLEKVEIATILGTLQATLTNFRYLRPIWKRNTAEEALLGVSLTGIMDCPILNGTGDTEGLRELLNDMRAKAVETNKVWAERLGISQSAATTCVKPSGTVSQLVDSASGIHPRFAPYYIRRVRGDKKDPMGQFLADSGIPTENDVIKPDANHVFSFPQKAPEGALCVEDVGAMEQLRLWKIYQDEWCEHKPSITVYYRDSEFLQVGQWLWENFDSVSGISFLPYSEHSYQQAPYEQITKEEYEAFEKIVIDFDKLAEYEQEDNTSGTQTMACTGNACEFVDVTAQVA